MQAILKVLLFLSLTFTPLTTCDNIRDLPKPFLPSYRDKCNIASHGVYYVCDVDQLLTRMQALQLNETLSVQEEPRWVFLDVWGFAVGFQRQRKVWRFVSRKNVRLVLLWLCIWLKSWSGLDSKGDFFCTEWPFLTISLYLVKCSEWSTSSLSYIRFSDLVFMLLFFLNFAFYGCFILFFCCRYTDCALCHYSEDAVPVVVPFDGKVNPNQHKIKSQKPDCSKDVRTQIFIMNHLKVDSSLPEGRLRTPNQKRPLKHEIASWLPDQLGADYARRLVNHWASYNCDPDLLILCYHGLTLGERTFRLQPPQAHVQLLFSRRLLMTNEGRLQIQRGLRHVRGLGLRGCFEAINEVFQFALPAIKHNSRMTRWAS